MTCMVSFRPMGSKGRYLKKCPKSCWPIRSKETWIKYTPTTLISHVNSHYREKYTFCNIKYFWAAKKIKNWLRPLYRPRTNHTCHQKPNPSREAVPLKGKTRLSIPASSPPVLRALGGWEEETRQQWAQAPSWGHGGERRHGPNCGWYWTYHHWGSTGTTSEYVVWNVVEIFFYGFLNIK